MDDTQRPMATESENALSRRDFAALTVAGAAAVATAAQAAMPVVQNNVTITTPDGTVEAVFTHPAGAGTWPAVIIHTDAFGLRPAFRSMAARLAAEGYAVLVPNPFYRTANVATAVPPGTSMATPGFREKFAEMRKPLTAAAVGSDTTAYVAWLDTQAAVKKTAKIGVQGYCMGGPMTFQSAAAAPNRVAGAATFHGGGLVTATPDSPHLLIPKMNPGVQLLIAVADNDDKNAPTDKDMLAKAFAEAKRKAEVKVYTGCMHGWCVTDGAVYAAAGAEDAWAMTLAIYKAKLV